MPAAPPAARARGARFKIARSRASRSSVAISTRPSPCSAKRWTTGRFPTTAARRSTTTEASPSPRRGLHREAIEDYNRAIQLYPEFAAVYNNRGNLLLGLDATREAIKDFDRAIVLAPGYAAAFSNRAGAYIRLGDTERALADYARAIELTPGSTAASTDADGHIWPHSARMPQSAISPAP